MPRGATPKREREYEELKDRFEHEHRYPGREDEVAARIVNKQRAMYGETRRERRKDREGTSPDRGLPIRDYQRLTVPQIGKQLAQLSTRDLRTIETYEKQHKNRKGVMELIEKRLESH